MQYDVIIIGAGHNGLTCAAYLARAGRRVLVLERRDVVGGCAVTEEVDPELAPGCRVSTASYIASMLRPTIIRDLKLGAYGLKMVACDPGVQAAFEDGDVERLVEAMHARGGFVTLRQAGAVQKPYEINIALFSAFGGRDEDDGGTDDEAQQAEQTEQAERPEQDGQGEPNRLGEHVE